jgi:hypothetical protein
MSHWWVKYGLFFASDDSLFQPPRPLAAAGAAVASVRSSIGLYLLPPFPFFFFFPLLGPPCFNTFFA